MISAQPGLKKSGQGRVSNEHMNLLLNATGENKTIEIELSTIDLLNQRLNIYGILVSSKRLIVGLLSQKLSVNSVLQLISSERLIIGLLNLKLNKSSDYADIENVLLHTETYVSHHIMPLVINSLGGRHTQTHTHTHTHTYT